jgi:hypothetical protein
MKTYIIQCLFTLCDSIIVKRTCDFSFILDCFLLMRSLVFVVVSLSMHVNDQILGTNT